MGRPCKGRFSAQVFIDLPAGARWRHISCQCASFAGFVGATQNLFLQRSTSLVSTAEDGERLAELNNSPRLSRKRLEIAFTQPSEKSAFSNHIAAIAKSLPGFATSGAIIKVLDRALSAAVKHGSSKHYPLRPRNLSAAMAGGSRRKAAC
jgi:hypothetical protein